MKKTLKRKSFCTLYDVQKELIKLYLNEDNKEVKKICNQIIKKLETFITKNI